MPNELMTILDAEHGALDLVGSCIEAGLFGSDRVESLKFIVHGLVGEWIGEREGTSMGSLTRLCAKILTLC